MYGKPYRPSIWPSGGGTHAAHQLSLDADLTALVAMGPSARRITPQALAARIRSLPSPFTVTVDLQIRVLQRRRDLARGIGRFAEQR